MHSESDINQDNSKKKTKVTNTIHDKCLFRCIVIGRVFEPETDQEIRAQSNTFPANEHDQVIGTKHKQ